MAGVKLPCLDGPRRAEWTTGREMVRADRDDKMKARCRTPKRRPSWTLFDQGASRRWTPWAKKATRAPSKTPVISGRDARMARIVTGWTSVQGESQSGRPGGPAY